MFFYPTRDTETGVDKTRAAYLYERKEVVYENLRDLSFEFKSGKFTQADYDGMRAWPGSRGRAHPGRNRNAGICKSLKESIPLKQVAVTLLLICSLAAAADTLQGRCPEQHHQ